MFRFSIPELCQRCDRIVTSFNRDTEEFVGYGYSAGTGYNLNSKNDALKAFPSDEYFEGLQQMATKEKNDSREALVNDLVDVRNRYKLCYGAESIDYKILKLYKINMLSDEEIVQKALHTNQVCETRLEKLGERMITQETLDNILAEREELDSAIDRQAAAITSRREKSLERIRLANELYELLSQICDVGKLIWKEKNEAFYMDYVIYGSSKPMVELEENTENA